MSNPLDFPEAPEVVTAPVASLLTIPALIAETHLQFVQFSNTARRTEKDSHFFGSVKISGVWHRVNTWIKTASNGSQFLSTSCDPMTAEQAAKAEERDQKYNPTAPTTPTATPVVTPTTQTFAPVPEETKPEPATPTKTVEPKVDLGLTTEQCASLGILVTDPRHPDYDAEIPF